MILRPYQQSLLDQIYQAWDTGNRNVLAVLPTGGGKTVVFSQLLKNHTGYSCVIAHRQELLSQISLSLAINGVPHRICAPDPAIREIVRQHVIEFKRSFYQPSAKVVVAGVDTLIRRNEEWMKQVTLWVLDEAHHLLRENKWGRAVALFPRAKGAGFTAHPERADGNGLGRAYDGLIDTLVIGPCGRNLIDAGHLSDYVVHTPPSSFHAEELEIGSTGDFKKPKMIATVKKARLVGSVVDCYLKFAKGLLGVTFATDIEEAQTFTDGFNQAGVPAALITSKTPLAERMGILRQFRSGKLLQLVNVDIFGEGFDLPALSVVSFARPTASRNLYCQQFGRSMRPLEGKPHAIVIDHVGNFQRHRFPDTPRNWSLERRERRSQTNPDADPITRCLNPECFRPYQAWELRCPYCGWKPKPLSRSKIEHVVGDLLALDLQTLEQMRAQVDQPFDAMKFQGVPQVALRAALKRHRQKNEAQLVLRESIGIWGALQRKAGKKDAESYKRFYLRMGTDVVSAQKLGAREALELNEKVRREL